jgi:hypothetical protein
MRDVTKLPDLVIAAGDTDSPQMAAYLVYDGADALTIFAPAVLGAGEDITVQVCDVDNGTQVWRDVPDSTIAANGVITFSAPAWAAFRIHSAVAVAADRTFNINIQ